MYIKTTKKESWVIIKKYYKHLGNKFHTNKHVCEEIAIIPSKKLGNKTMGYVTHLMKQIQRGPVRGNSIKFRKRGGRGEITMFLRSQPWIQRSLKLILTLRKC